MFSRLTEAAKVKRQVSPLETELEALQKEHDACLISFNHARKSLAKLRDNGMLMARFLAVQQPIIDDINCKDTSAEKEKIRAIEQELRHDFGEYFFGQPESEVDCLAGMMDTLDVMMEDGEMEQRWLQQVDSEIASIQAELLSYSEEATSEFLNSIES